MEKEVILEKERANAIEYTRDGHDKEKIAQLRAGHGSTGCVGNGVCAFEGEEGFL